jgi:hypothetical protein
MLPKLTPPKAEDRRWTTDDGRLTTVTNMKIKFFKCSKRVLIDLTGPAGLKTLPYWAVCRLPAGKLAGILTYFQRKVKKNLIADYADYAGSFVVVKP